MNTLTHKGYSRIYCETEADIAKVREVVKELDEYEYGYMPSNLVTVYTNYPSVVYTGKFSDLDMNALTAECWKRGIKIWVNDTGHNRDNFSDSY